MRLPSGYGQVIKLSGKRRRPYAVRVSGEIVEVSPGKFVRKEKYLEYFAKRSDALEYLAKYNAGIVVEKTPAVSALPSFREVFEGFIEYYENIRPDASYTSIRSYHSAFGNVPDLHHRIFKSLRLDDLQEAVSKAAETKSKGTVNLIIVLLHGMYKYACMNDIVEKDYSQFVYNPGTDPERPAHVPFTDEEIKRLWDDNAAEILIMIYTGVRIMELVGIRQEDVHLDEQYMRGGIKTKAGKDRIIPLHDAIMPFIRERMTGEEYLIPVPHARSRNNFVSRYWNPVMERLEMDHTPHDTRHTATSLMARADIPLFHRKLILGHAVTDVTEGVYTHVEPSELVRDINTLSTFR